MISVRRLTGPRPGRTDRERASGTTTKILSHWSGGYRDMYGCTRKRGGGGQKRDRHRNNREGTRAFRSRHATRATTGDETRDSRPLRGAPSPGHRKNREGTQAFIEASTLPGRRLAKRRETQDHCGGRRLLSPSTNTRAKYRQPHMSGGGAPTTIGILERTTVFLCRDQGV